MQGPYRGKAPSIWNADSPTVLSDIHNLRSFLRKKMFLKVKGKIYLSQGNDGRGSISIWILIIVTIPKWLRAPFILLYNGYRGVRIPASATASELVNKVHSAKSFFDKKCTRQNSVLTEVKRKRNWARLEHSPHKSLTRLAQQAKVSTTVAWTMTGYVYCCIKLYGFK